MARPGAKFVVLCEDVQHETFVRRTLKHLGFNDRPRVERAPGGRGCGEQWVRNRYPIEVKELRRGHVERTLVVTVDADANEVNERLRAFDKALEDASLAPRTKDERIVFVVPRRSIETWIHALSTDPLQGTDETRAYPRFRGDESSCDPAARRLAEYCRERRPVGQQSLEAACAEWRRVFP